MAYWRREVTLPELGLFAITRAALGAGIGLLAGYRLNKAARIAAGWALVFIGIATTVPLAMEIFSNQSQSPKNSEM